MKQTNADVAKLIQECNNNLMQSYDTLNIDNFDNSDGYNDKDPDYCYTTDSENSEIEDTQYCSVESNNTTKSSLETSLNVSGQQICDGTNLHVECSKPRKKKSKTFVIIAKKCSKK